MRPNSAVHLKGELVWEILGGAISRKCDEKLYRLACSFRGSWLRNWHALVLLHTGYCYVTME